MSKYAAGDDYSDDGTGAFGEVHTTVEVFSRAAPTAAPTTGAPTLTVAPTRAPVARAVSEAAEHLDPRFAWGCAAVSFAILVAYAVYHAAEKRRKERTREYLSVVELPAIGEAESRPEHVAE